MYVISNNIIEVGVNTLGAELEYIKINGIDILWKKTDLWNQQSPVLFPIVGGLKDGFYFYEGKKYELKPHGFISSKKFEVAYLDKNKIILSSKYDQDTLLCYPFKYELRLTYHIEDYSLKVSLEVKNLNDKQISFSIGIHPGFSYAGLYALLGSNFKMKFTSDKPKEILFNPSYVIGKTSVNIPYLCLDDISRDLEIKRTICYKGVNSLELSSKKCCLRFTNEMSYMAFWQKNPNNNPEFICIEGWDGIPDYENTNHNFNDKEGNIILSANDKYIRNFEIKIIKGE